jgi:methionyl aminopeptidase
VPSAQEILKEGDILNFDASTIYEGYIGDCSRMFGVGKISQKAQDLITVTKKCLDL